MVTERRRARGERKRSLRLGYVGRLGEHPARDEDVSRLGPRHEGHHRAGTRRPRSPRTQPSTKRPNTSISSSAIVPVDDEFRGRAGGCGRAVNENTIALVGSACNFPYGTIDPIEELSEIAKRRGVGLHVDGCLGGFFLPWAEKLGAAGAAVRLPPSGRHVDVVRHAQVRLRSRKGRRSCSIGARPCGGSSISRRPIGRAVCTIPRRFPEAGLAA